MNTTALAVIQPDELDTIQRTAKLLAASGFFNAQDGITGMAQVAAKILAGRELGFGPFAAVNGIHIIQGKPAVGANLMAAAVRAHPRYDYRVKELTDKACELEFLDNGKVAGNSRFTLEDAAAAELSSGKNAATWKKYARNMLFARAMSNGVRWYAPDIFTGNVVYVPEELGAEVDGEGNVIEVTPRVVDTTTGEITTSHQQDVSFDNPFDEPAAQEPTRVLASQGKRNRVHALGMEYYQTKEAWDEARPLWVKKATGDAYESSNDLSPEQADWIIEKLEARITKRAAEQAQQAEAV